VIDSQQFTLTLTDVKSHGTEDRPCEEFIPEVKGTIFPMILFNASQLADVSACMNETEDLIANDPAILNVGTKSSVPKRSNYVSSQLNSDDFNLFSKKNQKFDVTYTKNPSKFKGRSDKSANSRQTYHTRKDQQSDFSSSKNNYNVRSNLNHGIKKNSQSKNFLTTQPNPAPLEPIDLSNKINLLDITSETSNSDSKAEINGFFTGSSDFFDKVSAVGDEKKVYSRKQSVDENIVTFGEKLAGSNSKTSRNRIKRNYRGVWKKQSQNTSVENTTANTDSTQQQGPGDCAHSSAFSASKNALPADQHAVNTLEKENKPKTETMGKKEGTDSPALASGAISN